MWCCKIFSILYLIFILIISTTSKNHQDFCRKRDDTNFPSANPKFNLKRSLLINSTVYQAQSPKCTWTFTITLPGSQKNYNACLHHMNSARGDENSEEASFIHAYGADFHSLKFSRNLDILGQFLFTGSLIGFEESSSVFGSINEQGEFIGRIRWYKKLFYIEKSSKYKHIHEKNTVLYKKNKNEAEEQQDFETKEKTPPNIIFEDKSLSVEICKIQKESTDYTSAKKTRRKRQVDDEDDDDDEKNMEFNSLEGLLFRPMSTTASKMIEKIPDPDLSSITSESESGSVDTENQESQMIEPIVNLIPHPKSHHQHKQHKSHHKKEHEETEKNSKKEYKNSDGKKHKKHAIERKNGESLETHHHNSKHRENDIGNKEKDDSHPHKKFQHHLSHKTNNQSFKDLPDKDKKMMGEEKRKHHKKTHHKHEHSHEVSAAEKILDDIVEENHLISKQQPITGDRKTEDGTENNELIVETTTTTTTTTTEEQTTQKTNKQLADKDDDKTQLVNHVKDLLSDPKEPDLELQLQHQLQQELTKETQENGAELELLENDITLDEPLEIQIQLEPKNNNNNDLEATIISGIVDPMKLHAQFPSEHLNLDVAKEEIKKVDEKDERNTIEEVIPQESALLYTVSHPGVLIKEEKKAVDEENSIGNYIENDIAEPTEMYPTSLIPDEIVTLKSLNELEELLVATNETTTSKPAQKIFTKIKRVTSTSPKTSSIVYGKNAARKRHLHNDLNGLTCQVSLAADHKFFLESGGSNVGVTIGRMLYFFDQAEWVIRSTDWNEDGLSDNFGFRISNMIIEMEARRDKSVFDDIDRFSTVSKVYQNCLTIGFSFEPPELDTMTVRLRNIDETGKANEEVSNKKNKKDTSDNCLARAVVVVSVVDSRGQELPDILIVHRLLYGILKALSNPLKETCGHADDLIDGFYEQDKPSVSDDDTSFSPLLRIHPCIRSHIADQLFHHNEDYSSFLCLKKRSVAFCGNGILETGEMCDCGSEENCKQQMCCHPRGNRAKQCRFTLGSTCFDPSGTCCNPITCTLNDLAEEEGLSCRTRICNIETNSEFKNGTNAQRMQSCGALSQSFGLPIQTKCMKGRCQSDECSRLNLRECTCTSDSFQYNKLDENSNLGSCSVCCEYPTSGQKRCLQAQKATHLTINHIQMMYDKWRQKMKMAQLSKDDMFQNFLKTNEKLETIWTNLQQQPQIDSITINEDSNTDRRNNEKSKSKLQDRIQTLAFCITSNPKKENIAEKLTAQPQQNGDQCIDLTFLQWPINGYCVAHGIVSFCGQDAVCSPQYQVVGVEKQELTKKSSVFDNHKSQFLPNRMQLNNVNMLQVNYHVVAVSSGLKIIFCVFDMFFSLI